MTTKKVTTDKDTKDGIALALRNDDVWRQVFCAALTGILASGDTEEGTDWPAFDAVMFAAQVADEAMPSQSRRKA